MKEKSYSKEFENEGLKYLATLDVTREFSFELRSGSSIKGSSTDRDYYDLFSDLPNYGDRDLNRSAVSVYRKAGEILVEWVMAYKPWKVSFSATTDRKIKIYRYFAKRLSGILPAYNLMEYPIGVFNFYRNPVDN